MTENFDHTDTDDITVLQFIDGDRSPAVLDALRRMPDAAQRIADLGGLHNRLTGNFYRTNCVDTTLLADYVSNVLPAVERQQIAAHVADCAQCAPEVEIMRAAYRDVTDMPLATIGQKVRRLLHAVKLGAGNVGQVAPPPAFAVRDASATADVPLIYTIGDDIEISLNVRPDRTRPGARVLFAQVSDFVEPQQWAGASVRLVTRTRGTLVASATADSDGSCEFVGLLPGDYGVTISGTDADLVVDEIRV